MTALAARPEYATMHNPFDQTLAAYTFNAACSVAGDVGLLPATVNGQSVVGITYGTNVKGTYTANTLPKSPETSLGL